MVNNDKIVNPAIQGKCFQIKKMYNSGVILHIHLQLQISVYIYKLLRIWN